LLCLHFGTPPMNQEAERPQEKRRRYRIIA
jgi:hypothetical protein